MRSFCEAEEILAGFWEAFWGLEDLWILKVSQTFLWWKSIIKESLWYFQRFQFKKLYLQAMYPTKSHITIFSENTLSVIKFFGNAFFRPPQNLRIFAKTSLRKSASPQRFKSSQNWPVYPPLMLSQQKLANQLKMERAMKNLIFLGVSSVLKREEGNAFSWTVDMPIAVWNVVKLWKEIVLPAQLAELQSEWLQEYLINTIPFNKI